MNYTIKQLPQFSDWLKSLKDGTTRLRLVKRLRKVSWGNLGDVSSIGDGVYETREHFGPGWRMYFVLRGQTIVIIHVQEN